MYKVSHCHFSLLGWTRPPATVPRPMPFYMLLSDVSLTPHRVRLNLSPCSLILYLFCQPLQLFYLTLKSLFDTQSPSFFPTFKVIHFQWIPGHSFLPVNDLADSLKLESLLTPRRYHCLTIYFLPTSIPLHQFETQ